MKRSQAALLLVVASTVLGLMGTDLVLPAVPSLPDTLGGRPADAQFVLAAYAFGTGIGLLLFGTLGDRFETRRLFVASLLLTAVISFTCAIAPDIRILVGLRAVQGAVAAGPAVFAPAIIRSMFAETAAIRAIGLLGSIEGLTPALAPILGAWLLVLGGWHLSFAVMAAAALLLVAANLALPLIPHTSRRTRGSYAKLLADPVYLRYALSQAFVLGGLLVFVFGAPAVLVRGFGGTLSDFILMQVCGVGAFIVAANTTGLMSAKYGAERLIALGTGLAVLGTLALLIYGLAGGRSALTTIVLFVPLNAGLGLRGPPGFYRAIVASGRDDARGSALVIVATMAATASGTAIVAPFIEHGLAPLAATALVFEAAALACMFLLPGLREAQA